MLRRMCFVIIVERLFWFLLLSSYYDSAVDLTLGCKLESFYNKCAYTWLGSQPFQWFISVRPRRAHIAWYFPSVLGPIVRLSCRSHEHDLLRTCQRHATPSWHVAMVWNSLASIRSIPATCWQLPRNICYKEVMRKLLPWNLALSESVSELVQYTLMKHLSWRSSLHCIVMCLLLL